MLLNPILVKSASSLGEKYVAIYGVIMKIIGSGTIFIFGFGLGISSLTGIFLGEKNEENTKKLGDYILKIVGGFYLILWILVFFFSDEIINVYLSKLDNDLKDYSVFLLKIASILLILEAFRLTFNFIFAGAGVPKFSFKATLIAYWVFLVPSIFLIKHLGYFNIFNLFILIIISRIIVNAILYLKYLKFSWIN
jgi:Na+-driven multidrug efflux pump